MTDPTVGLRATLRMAILNHPTAPFATPWSAEALVTLRDLGFTAIQVNIGWGTRPGGEALNFEDVVALTPEQDALAPQPLRLNSDPASYEDRRETLRSRVALAREAGLRTAFNVGAPYNRHGIYGGNPPNCILDEGVVRRYELLVTQFARDFGVDDLWLYTYDQDAWLCSEFGTCPRCSGIPLHERVTPFLERLAAAWTAATPGGRIWWEPWELSAGQVLAVLERIDVHGLGLALHNNVAEVMAAFAVDRHVKNQARLAAERGMPVTLEGYFGAATEEVEPFVSLQSPLTTYRQVRAMLSVPGVTGVKEYFGLDISGEDPNLRASALAFDELPLDDREVLSRLSEGYGDRPVRELVEETWTRASEAMETYPWDASWYVREVGKSDPAHSLNAAAIRGWRADTPAWLSTRGSTFMVIDDIEPHPWLLEDLQLRWQRCADLQAQALATGRAALSGIATAMRPSFERFLDELAEFRRRVLAYAYHCRETNVAGTIRCAVDRGDRAPEGSVRELAALLSADFDNSGDDALLHARDELLRDAAAFVATYFLPTPATAEIFDYPGEAVSRPGFPQPRGEFSATSR